MSFHGDDRCRQVAFDAAKLASRAIGCAPPTECGCSGVRGIQNGGNFKISLRPGCSSWVRSLFPRRGRHRFDAERAIHGQTGEDPSPAAVYIMVGIVPSTPGEGLSDVVAISGTKRLRSFQGHDYIEPPTCSTQRTGKVIWGPIPVGVLRAGFYPGDPQPDAFRRAWSAPAEVSFTVLRERSGS